MFSCFSSVPSRFRLASQFLLSVSVVALCSGGLIAGARANDVMIDTTYADASVYGNSAVGDPTTRSGSASGNSVHLVTGANVTHVGGNSGDVFGGYAASGEGDSDNNTVTMDDGTVETAIYAGRSFGTGSVSNNSVTLNGGSVTYTVYGGAASDTGDAKNNSVIVNGGSVGAGVYGGQSQYGDATDNSVTVNGGTLGGAYGGRSASRNASKNSVSITNGIVNTVIGGYAGKDSTSSNNTVTVSGGTVGMLVGGVNSGTYDGSTLLSLGSVLNSTVTVSGGTVGTIYGAYVTAVSDHGGSAGAVNGIGTGNTINILGGSVTGPISGAAAGLVGSLATYDDLFSDNTLNLKVSGLTITGLNNFEYLNFYLPTTLADGDTMLTVSGTADLTRASVESSVVNVGINGSSSALAEGDTITLIDASTLITHANLNTTANGTGMQGVTLAYDFAIAKLADTLTATVTGVGVAENSKALSEGGAVEAAVLNRGNDLSAGLGMANALGAARSNTTTFSALSGGSIRTETGSHVDVDGVSLLAGLAGTFDLLDNPVVVAPFVEYGYGSYNTYNTFSSGAVHGTGDSYYVGGGVLGHMDLMETEAGHAYIEGGARFGLASNSFSSADLASAGVAAHYDASSAYYGLSAGLGYVWDIDDASSLDIYGRYSWNELGSESVVLSTGETVNFNTIDSQRVRLGARYSYDMSEQVVPYLDLTWEHEFDGGVSATTNGLAIAEPTLAGDTGIVSAGLTLKPSENLPLSLDLNLSAYFGRNQGFAGGLQAKYAF